MPPSLMTTESPTLPRSLRELSVGERDVGEYAWRLADIERAVAIAANSGLATLGGQLQFRVPDGPVCELHWIEADASPQRKDEPWSDYVRRSAEEVISRARRALAKADLSAEAGELLVMLQSDDPRYRSLTLNEILDSACFVLYFQGEKAA